MINTNPQASDRFRGPMSTLETPEELSPEPKWSIATALLFVLIWIVLLFVIQITLMQLVALARGVAFSDLIATFQDGGLPSTQAAVSAVGVALSWIATFGLLARLFRRHPRPVLLRALGIEPPRNGWAYLVGIPVGLGLLGAGTVLMHLLNVAEN